MPTQTFPEQPFSSVSYPALKFRNEVRGSIDSAEETLELNAARGILVGIVLSVPFWIAGLLFVWSLT